MRFYGIRSGRNKPAAYLVRSYMWARRSSSKKGTIKSASAKNGTSNIPSINSKYLEQQKRAREHRLENENDQKRLDFLSDVNNNLVYIQRISNWVNTCKADFSNKFDGDKVGRSDEKYDLLLSFSNDIQEQVMFYEDNLDVSTDDYSEILGLLILVGSSFKRRPQELIDFTDRIKRKRKLSTNFGTVPKNGSNIIISDDVTNQEIEYWKTYIDLYGCSKTSINKIYTKISASSINEDNRLKIIEYLQRKETEMEVEKESINDNIANTTQRVSNWIELNNENGFVCANCYYKSKNQELTTCPKCKRSMFSKPVADKINAEIASRSSEKTVRSFRRLLLVVAVSVAVLFLCISLSRAYWWYQFETSIDNCDFERASEIIFNHLSDKQSGKAYHILASSEREWNESNLSPKELVCRYPNDYISVKVTFSTDYDSVSAKSVLDFDSLYVENESDFDIVVHNIHFSHNSEFYSFPGEYNVSAHSEVTFDNIVQTSRPELKSGLLGINDIEEYSYDFKVDVK